MWQETWVALFGLFSGMETAYFDRSEEEEAVNGLRNEFFKPVFGGL